MSISIDYFFNSEKSFEQLNKEINDFLGCNFELSKEYEEQSHAKFFGISWNFYVHNFENDGLINFEDYKYYIGSTTYWGSADLRWMQVPLTVLSPVTAIRG